MPKKNGKNGNGKNENNLPLVGRPTYYHPVFVKIAEYHARRGVFTKETTANSIAEMFGVCKKTIYNWFASHPEFLHAIRKLQDIDDSQVESSILNNAIGYEYEERYENYKVVDGIEVLQTITHAKKWNAGNPADRKFWAINRMGWKYNEGEDPNSLAQNFAETILRLAKERNSKIEIIANEEAGEAENLPLKVSEGGG